MTTSTKVLLVAVVLGAGSLPAQSQGESESLKLLRQTIADQKQYPDKVIRTYTNLPPTEAKSAAPASEAPPVAVVAQSKPAPTPEPKTAPPSPPPSSENASADKKAAAAELERQFLNGKISARKYQKALAELENPSKPPATQAKPKPAPTTASTPTPPKPSSGPSVATPTTPESPPQPAANQKRVSEVEAKIDDMIRQKEARESAAKTNAPPAPAAPLTKRQRLDFLLRQVIDGKLSDAEYKKEREKILAEPE